VVTVTLQIGALRQSVTLTGPGSPVPDGNGGFTLVYAPLDPSEWRCAIEKATVQNAEQHFASTVLSRATYIVSGRYHPGIDTKSRMTWVDRSGATHVANVLDVNDTEGAGVETVALITEVVS
jgi:hypothetical protein